MKVVLFCGGKGMRLREQAEPLPKPLVCIGDEAILWEVMRYYAHHGHDDFVLCIGYQGDAVRAYVDAALHRHGLEQRWRVTFVDSGVEASIGQRLRAAYPHVSSERFFLANYADGLSDLDLHRHVARALAADKTAALLSVPSPQPFHVVEQDAELLVTSVRPLARSAVRINGGYFVFRHDVFAALTDGDDLVPEALSRLTTRRELIAFPHDGFWRSMDTFKDLQELRELASARRAPWRVWEPEALHA